MTTKKKMSFRFWGIVAVSTVLLLVTCLAVYWRYVAPQSYVIGILQTAKHPALEAARKGFQDTLEERWGDRVRYIVGNAQGSVGLATVLAQKMYDDTGIVAVAAFGTPAAQALAHRERRRPLVVAAIADPIGSGLGEASNVAGTADRIDSSKEIDLIQKLAPQVRTVALLYNRSEVNSEIVARELRAELLRRGLQVVEVTIIQEQELLLAVDEALQKADAILAPVDNMVATAITYIADKAKEARKPLFVCDLLLVDQGAVAGAGVDFYESGRVAAQILISVLEGTKTPGDVGFIASQIGAPRVNIELAKSLGLQVPPELLVVS